MLLVVPSIGTGELSPIGTAALTVSSIAWAIGCIYSSKTKLPVSILASSAMIMITGGLMLTAVSFALGEYRNLDLLQISRQSLAAQIYLILIITVVGFTDFYWLLRVASASLANTFAYVSPVIAVLMGWAILHEMISIISIVAMVVSLIGVALMVTKSITKKANTTVATAKIGNDSYSSTLPKTTAASTMNNELKQAMSVLLNLSRKIGIKLRKIN
jgi:drug/metabolite transporter (DMT)-like permease